MKLVHRITGKEVKEGDELTSFRGEKYYAGCFREPGHGAGKIAVRKNPDDAQCCREFHVGVFDLQWVD